ncbi:MAG: hypothetical protein JXI33_04515 [Candidatus Aminicenantes bacterium]|nr:hypothetical protein [Candidatus Aminicenantes bacterium]
MSANWIATLDPRVKLVAFLAVQGLLFMSPAHFLPSRLLAIAVVLLALLPWAGRAWHFWLRTLALTAPFLAFLSLSAWLLPSASRADQSRIILALVGKSMLVFLSLALFIMNDAPWRLLQALRQAGLPRSALVVMAIGYRFAGQWRLELHGMHRAWTGRNFSALSKLSQARVLGRALPQFFERLLNGGVHIHDAMLSRGFHGALPGWQRLVFARRDAFFMVLVSMTTMAIMLLS